MNKTLEVYAKTYEVFSNSYEECGNTQTAFAATAEVWLTAWEAGRASL